MNRKEPLAIICWLGVLLAMSALGVASYLQYFQEQAPCALCVLQRYAYVGMGLTMILLARWHRARKILAWLVAVPVSLAGTALALRHLWVVAHPEMQCGRDVLEEWVNSLPPAQWSSFFRANGFCFDSISPLWGIDLPVWSLIGMLILLGSSVFVGLRYRNCR